MEKSRKALKTVTISEVVFLLNEGTTDEKETTAFLVAVVDGSDVAEEPFDTRQQAEEYASDVIKRPLRPFSVEHILDAR